MTDDLPFGEPTTAPNPAAPKPRCRRHVWVMHGDATRPSDPPGRCYVCGHIRDEARARRVRDARAKQAWWSHMSARCECGHVRHHVSHEMDPETSAEGPEYHAGFAHHAFVAQVEERPVRDSPVSRAPVTVNLTADATAAETALADAVESVETLLTAFVGMGAEIDALRAAVLAYLAVDGHHGLYDGAAFHDADRVLVGLVRLEGIEAAQKSVLSALK